MQEQMLWLADAYEELAVCEETNWSKKMTF